MYRDRRIAIFRLKQQVLWQSELNNFEVYEMTPKGIEIRYSVVILTLFFSFYFFPFSLLRNN